MKGKIDWKNKEDVNKWRRQNRRKNITKIKKQDKEWRQKNPDKVRDSWNSVMFDGKKDEALERDNWECQDCGMSQEKSIILFNRVLSIHHIDDNGANVPSHEKNNNLDNLITLCMRCHKILHHKQTMEKRWGDLIEQDDSDWEFPKIRYLVESEIKKGHGVQESKRIVSKNTGMGFSLVDHRYYEKKRRVINQRGKEE